LGLVGGPVLLSTVAAAAAADAGWDLEADRPVAVVASAGQAVLGRVVDLAGSVMVADVVVRDRVAVADDPDVAAALTGLAQVGARVESLLVALVVQACERGAHRDLGMGLRDWVASRTPHLSRAQVNDLVTVAEAVATGGPFASRSAAAFSSVAQGVESGQLPVGRAARVVRSVTSVRGVFDDQETLGSFVDALVVVASRQDVTDRELRVLLDEAVTTLLPEKETTTKERAARELRGVTESSLAEGNVVRFVVTTDKDGAATIRAVLASPLAAPAPDGDSPVDTRSAAQRKHDALLTVIGRGVASAEGVPTTTKARVVVTMTLADLLGRLTNHGHHRDCTVAGPDLAAARARGCRCVVVRPESGGSAVTGTGEVLSPSLARKLACGAEIVPVVLGTDGMPLDVGRASRLATPAQLTALWVRDKGCTFPGCTVPPGWCDAHHLVWWSRGGPTDLVHLALLCPRHHTTVHERDLVATWVNNVLTWHVR
jgi:hypothetical protein